MFKSDVSKWYRDVFFNMGLAAPAWLLSGDADSIVPTAHVRRLPSPGRDDRIELRTVAEDGHFEPVLPGTSSWAALRAELLRVRAADTR